MKTYLSWSSGKDSAWTLHELRQNPEIELCGLVSTINAEADRVAMHGVRRTLLMAQAEAAGLPLLLIPLPNPCPNDIYEREMAAFLANARTDGIEAMAFGDLFLEDIRRYREDRLRGTGLTPLFPLWQQPTAQLAQRMIIAGLKAWLSCIDTAQLDASFAGRQFDGALLADLPRDADPCGENGEFHSFVSAGPMFRAPIPVRRGSTIERGRFLFTDFLPASAPSA